MTDAQERAGLREAANYVIDVWADTSQEDCSGTNAMDDAIERLRAALAAPVAEEQACSYCGAPSFRHGRDPDECKNDDCTLPVSHAGRCSYAPAAAYLRSDAAQGEGEG